MHSVKNYSETGTVFTGRNSGIAITHVAILRYFASQGRHVPSLITKFGTAKETKGPLCHVRFYIDRSIFGDFWLPNHQKSRNE